MYCATKQFPELKFLGPQNKPNGVHGLGKNHHMRFDPKLGHGTYAIRFTPCACTSCTSILDQPWVPGFQHRNSLSINLSNITHTDLC